MDKNEVDEFIKFVHFEGRSDDDTNAGRRFWQRLFLIFCINCRTEAYWDEAKRGRLLALGVNRNHIFTFCLGSKLTCSHISTFLLRLSWQPKP